MQTLDGILTLFYPARRGIERTIPVRFIAAYERQLYRKENIGVSDMPAGRHRASWE